MKYSFLENNNRNKKYLESDNSLQLDENNPDVEVAEENNNNKNNSFEKLPIPLIHLKKHGLKYNEKALSTRDKIILNIVYDKIKKKNLENVSNSHFYGDESDYDESKVFCTNLLLKNIFETKNKFEDALKPQPPSNQQAKSPQAAANLNIASPKKNTNQNINQNTKSPNAPNTSSNQNTKSPNKSPNTQTRSPNNASNAQLSSSNKSPNNASNSQTNSPNKTSNSQTKSPNPSSNTQTAKPNQPSNSKTNAPDQPSDQKTKVPDRPSTDNANNNNSRSSILKHLQYEINHMSSLGRCLLIFLIANSILPQFNYKKIKNKTLGVKQVTGAKKNTKGKSQTKQTDDEALQQDSFVLQKIDFKDGKDKKYKIIYKDEIFKQEAVFHIEPNVSTGSKTNYNIGKCWFNASVISDTSNDRDNDYSSGMKKMARVSSGVHSIYYFVNYYMENNTIPSRSGGLLDKARDWALRR